MLAPDSAAIGVFSDPSWRRSTIGGVGEVLSRGTLRRSSLGLGMCFGLGLSSGTYIRERPLVINLRALRALMGYVTGMFPIQPVNEGVWT